MDDNFYGGLYFIYISLLSLEKGAKWGPGGPRHRGTGNNYVIRVILAMSQTLVSKAELRIFFLTLEVGAAPAVRGLNAQG